MQDPAQLYTECGEKEFQCRKQRIGCPDVNGRPDYQCEAPAGLPLCLRHDVEAASQKLCLADSSDLITCDDTSDIRDVGKDLVRNGYYDCIDRGPNNKNEVIYDFSDELHDPTSAYSAPALLLSPLSLAVGS